MAITPLVLSASSASSSSSSELYPSHELPSLVAVHPVAIASILDHHLRRPRDAKGNEQDRVIGTLMGVRDEAGTVNVLSSFGVPFGEVEGKLLLGTEALRQQLEIVSKASPKLRVVGWYVTHPEPNSWTPLIHDEYLNLASSGAPSSSSNTPIHLTVDVNSLKLNAYGASKLGLSPESANRTFVPLRTELKVQRDETSGLDLLTKHSVPSTRSSESSSSQTQQLVAPLVSMHSMLSEVQTMLSTVLSYVQSVLSGSTKGDSKVGRYLLETLGSVPVTSTGAKEGQSFEEEFNTHLADLLMVSYLANVVRVNLEVASRAGMLHDARLAPRSN